MKVAVTVILLNVFSAIRTQSSNNANSVSAVVRQLFEINPDGRYSYAFETENNIYAEEEGNHDEDRNLIKQGQYQYTAPDGEVIRTIYTADAEGFHPQGAHLPTAPPLPSASFSLQNWPH